MDFIHIDWFNHQCVYSDWLFIIDYADCGVFNINRGSISCFELWSVVVSMETGMATVGLASNGQPVCQWNMAIEGSWLLKQILMPPLATGFLSMHPLP